MTITAKVPRPYLASVYTHNIASYELFKYLCSTEVKATRAQQSTVEKVS